MGHDVLDKDISVESRSLVLVVLPGIPYQWLLLVVTSVRHLEF